MQWPTTWEGHNIARKEIAPVLLVAATWGKSWAGKCVLFRSDNMAVVTVLQKNKAKDRVLLQLLRCLHFYAAVWQFSYTAEHIAGELNTAADALSRNKLSLFRSITQVDSPPAAIPPAALVLAFHGPPDWTSHRWTELFRNSLT